MSRWPHARSWVGIIAEDRGICWPPYVCKGSSQMSGIPGPDPESVRVPMRRACFIIWVSLYPSLSHKITQFLFLSIPLPLICLLSSSVPWYPINSLPQCLSSLVLIIKFAPSSRRKDYLSVQTPNRQRPSTDICFLNNLWLRQWEGNCRCHTPTQGRAHSQTRMHLA